MNSSLMFLMMLREQFCEKRHRCRMKEKIPKEGSLKQCCHFYPGKKAKGRQSSNFGDNSAHGKVGHGDLGQSADRIRDMSM